MRNAPDRRPQRLGLLALVFAVVAVALLPATTYGRSHDGPSPAGERPPARPAAVARTATASSVPAPPTPTSCAAGDTPPEPALLVVTERTPPPAADSDGTRPPTTGDRATACRDVRPQPVPTPDEPAPSPARALAERARTGALACDELDANAAQGLITAAETATLRVTTGCPVAPPAVTTVRYQVAVVGAPQADLGEFRLLAARALADPRGWRGAGVAFVEVPEDADFTLWLAQAEAMAGFGEPCMADWSCASGTDVVINDLRWREASPAWVGGGGTLADYRRMVLSHEVGHWLGLDHENCSVAGSPAPLMQQQSKDLLGCLPNAWPLPGELAAVAIGVDAGAGAWLAGG